MAVSSQPLNEVLIAPPTVSHETDKYNVSEARLNPEVVEEERKAWYDTNNTTVLAHVESVIYLNDPTSRTNSPSKIYIYLAGVALPIIKRIEDINPNAVIKPGRVLKVTRAFINDEDSIQIQCLEAALIKENERGRASIQHVFPRGSKEKRNAAHSQRLH